LNEHRRLQYLEAIGIDTYVPRWLLPNAPAAQLCDLPSPEELHASAEAGTEVGTKLAASAFAKDSANASKAARQHLDTQDTHSTAVREAVSSEAVSSLSKSLSSVLDDLSSTSPRARPTSLTEKQNGDVNAEIEDQSASGDERAAEVERVRFQLGLWITDTSIQVVDSREPGDALPTAALLQNMLIACGLMKTHLPAMGALVFPVAGTPEDEQGWSDAFSTMSDFFKFRFKAKPASAMIVCGEDAAKSVVGPDVDYQATLFTCLPIERLGLDAIILPSLRDFLYKPELKSSIWHALLPLRNSEQ